MATHTHIFARTDHARRSLASRGGLARTFGSLACFLAITFLGIGVYILTDAFANPLTAQPVEVVAGAFVIALASIILFYLFKPRKKLGVTKIKCKEKVRQESEGDALESTPRDIRANEIRVELPYRRRATDHAPVGP